MLNQTGHHDNRQKQRQTQSHKMYFMMFMKVSLIMPILQVKQVS